MLEIAYQSFVRPKKDCINVMKYINYNCILKGGIFLHTISEKKEDIGEAEQNIEQSKEDMELPLFDLATIAKATNNFSFNKKLGEGGFGPVYKVISNMFMYLKISASFIK